MKRVVFMFFGIFFIFMLVLLSVISSERNVSEDANPINENVIVEEENNIQNVTFQEALDLMEENEEAVLIDVRTVEEFEERSYHESINVPLANIGNSIETVVPNKQTPVILICRSGNRSAQAAEILQSQGYDNLFDGGGLPEDLSEYE